MKRVIFNQKGGVGKSTITCNLAAIAAARGKRTLVIDLDPQCNSTQYLLGAAADAVAPTLADFFDQMLSFSLYPKETETFIHPTPFPGLDLMPAHPDMDALQGKLESRYKIYKLRDALNGLEGYDAVYLDTPPALNFFTRSALIAGQGCLIPFDCDDFSRRALYALLENVQEIRQDHNPALEVEGIVVNQFQARANLPQKLVQELKDEGLPVLASTLSASVKIRESHEQARPLVHLAAGHKVTREFLQLHEELDRRRKPARGGKARVRAEA
jgi:chromosome partitioning protein